MQIKNIIAREILDSRGNPTVEVDMEIENGIICTASVPSGASTGSREALELRDNDPKRYNGKGVLNAVNNINNVIKPELIGKDVSPKEIDDILISMDNTNNKSNLGANATLAVSLAAFKCLAKLENKELYELFPNEKKLPIPMINIINGGMHAVNSMEIQEFMIVPMFDTMKERIRASAETFHALKKILSDNQYNVGVGDEGGFAPNLESNEKALEFIVEAIKKAGYKPGEEIYIALDTAASEFYNEETKKYTVDGKEFDSEGLIKYYLDLINKYPIISIEDPFYENDFETLQKFTTIIGSEIMIVGDDYFVTNKEYLQKGIDMHAGNAILLKANQIGTISEMLETINLARYNKYKMIISHRSGETEDTFIADLAVGLGLTFIKTGSMCRGERIAKYNRLLRIEEKLNK